MTEGSVYASVTSVDSRDTLGGTSADVVVVGGGTVGAWCATFLRRSGLGRVVLVERATLGQGASSRAAGIVRSQGGTPTAVRLAEWSRHFYRTQHEWTEIDSGFVTQGYYLPCFTMADRAAAQRRMAMQRSLGQAVRWVDADEAETLNPTLALGSTLGGTYLDDDGYINPPRNVLAYTVALTRTGVEVFEQTSFDGLVVSGNRVVGVADEPGPCGHQFGRVDGRPGARRGRRPGRCPHPGWWRQAPGGRDRTPP